MPYNIRPDATAVRVALWRALHARLDAPPHVLEDELGLALAAPEPGWEQRPDMDPERTGRFRAGIVARARWIEELVEKQAAKGVGQYALLGAGLDTFAQRKPRLASRLQVFEVDRPGASEWKRRRLLEAGFGVPAWLHLVGVDFARGDDWLALLSSAGFDAERPAVVAAAGLSMYLAKEANAALLRRAALLAPGTTFALTFIRPIPLLDAEDQPALAGAAEGAQASGTPFVSFYAADEMLALARQAGFREARVVTSADYSQRYFAARADGLRPSSGEDLLVART